MVGIHDRETSTLTLVSAPFLQVSRTLKKDALGSSSRTSVSTGNMMQDRRSLGEMFGNRKQKQNARNQDRMKVQVFEEDGLDTTIGHVVKGIDKATEGTRDAGECMWFRFRVLVRCAWAESGRQAQKFASLQKLTFPLSSNLSSDSLSRNQSRLRCSSSNSTCQPQCFNSSRSLSITRSNFNFSHGSSDCDSSTTFRLSNQ